VDHPQIAVFARLANGNAQTVRRIEGQKTNLNRPIHSISYDDIHDELVVPSAQGQAIMTFRGAVDGEEAPIRIIQGPKTQLVFPDMATIDPMHNEIVVPVRGAGVVEGHNMIYVFDRTAQGDVAPIRRLGGPDTNLSGNPSVVWDHDLLLSSSRRGSSRGVAVFNRTDTGNAKPLRVITGGPKSGTNGPGTPVWIPGTRNFLAETRPFGAKTAGDLPGAPENYQTPGEALTYIGVWSIDDNGDVAPRYTIAHNILKEFRNIALDAKNKTIMIADKTANGIYTFSFPEAWESFAPITAQTN
jgi:hypothetical protein